MSWQVEEGDLMLVDELFGNRVRLELVNPKNAEEFQDFGLRISTKLREFEVYISFFPPLPLFFLRFAMDSEDKQMPFFFRFVLYSRIGSITSI